MGRVDLLNWKLGHGGHGWKIQGLYRVGKHYSIGVEALVFPNDRFELNFKLLDSSLANWAISGNTG